MDTYATESEQIEFIKSWWKNYGKITLISIIIALIASYGWRSYLQRHERMLEKASVIYERLLIAASNNDDVAMANAADRLIDHYRHTPYSQLAALMLAKQAVYKGDLDIAERKLQWIMKHGNNSALRQIARIRAARVFLAENRPVAALDLLDKVDDKDYTALIDEARGDVLLVLNKKEEARKAYSDALQAFPGIDVMQPLLQMKLDNLA